MEENTEEKVEQAENYEGLSDWDKLTKAEELIESGELDEAQNLIDAVEVKIGRKYFVQSKLFNAKGWFNEQRKQLKKALKFEPENEEYKKALDELEDFRKSAEYKQMKTVQMGDKDSLIECCCLSSCECCATGLCEAICEGCS